MIIHEAVEEFLLSCQADNLSDTTVKWYRSIITPLATEYGDRAVADITTRDMRLYIVSLQSRDTRYEQGIQKPPQKGGLSRDSIASHVVGLHRFWNWCSAEYSIPNPMAGIKRPKRPPRQPKAITKQDFVKLFEATLPTVEGIRDRALLAFMADSGCRLGGLLNLKVDYLQLERNRAVVEEKSEKTRLVVFTAMTRRLLEDWLAVRKSEHPEVFCSPKTGKPLTESGIHQLLKRLKDRAGVRGRVNPHAFRHNFARQYILNGGDIVTLARLLGHEDISTTVDYYAVFTADEVAELHERYSPMTKFTLKDQ